LGIVSEYVRRSIKERTAGAQERAVARGAWPVGRVPLGYIRQPDGTLGVDSDASTAELVRAAFRMRADGATIPAIRTRLFENGIDRTDRGVQQMLGQRLYLGEIHYGQYVNREACDPIIDRELFDRVQRMVVPRGRVAKSTRLLARQKVLRCGVCGAALSVDGGNERAAAVYRCVPRNNHRCPNPVAITATIAEHAVTDAVRNALRDADGRASASDGAQDAATRLSDAQAALDAAIRSLTASGLGDEPVAVESLSELRAARDEAQAGVDQIGKGAVATINAADDWDSLTLDEQRALIRAVVAEALVMPHAGRRRWDGGADRIQIKLVGEG
jgi:hypothetical protein